ncbi:uncharacterized protein PG998_003696 [Apiospora kogelbergensis]|uniref:Uncharacterized protein n=1 Tax=Apiospora kogelbergensis TaxID=1337665 RepID=A0AAW0QK16_9PEZI
MPKLPVDPRNLLPSRADPENRSRRKELEKQHGYGYTEPLILAAIGIGLVWNIDNQVRKHEERKDEAEKADEDRRERRRQRELAQYGAGRGDTRSGSRYDDPQQQDRSRDRRRGGGGDWDDRRRERDRGSDSRSRPRRDSSRYAAGDRADYVRDDPRKLDYRYEEYRGFRDDYKDFRNDYRYEDRRDGSVRRSCRRDSF